MKFSAYVYALVLKAKLKNGKCRRPLNEAFGCRLYYRCSCNMQLQERQLIRNQLTLLTQKNAVLGVVLFPACQAVTALLQYFLLAAFCWMLCEGIMLYLMLVVVFSSLSKKWWFFFILGWRESTLMCNLLQCAFLTWI